MGADDLAVDQPRQVALLQLLRAELLQRDRRADDLGGQREQEPGVPAPVAQLLQHVDERERVVAEPAPLFGERDPDHAGFADQLPLVAVEPLGGIVLEHACVEGLVVLLKALAQRLLLVVPVADGGGQCHRREP